MQAGLYISFHILVQYYCYMRYYCHLWAVYFVIRITTLLENKCRQLRLGANFLLMISDDCSTPPVPSPSPPPAASVISPITRNCFTLSLSNLLCKDLTIPVIYFFPYRNSTVHRVQEGQGRVKQNGGWGGGGPNVWAENSLSAPLRSKGGNKLF